MNDAELWGVAWALFAAAAGLGLTVAAMAFLRRHAEAEMAEFAAGYNALAPQLDR